MQVYVFLFLCIGVYVCVNLTTFLNTTKNALDTYFEQLRIYFMTDSFTMFNIQKITYFNFVKQVFSNKNSSPCKFRP